ncbi:hypothetical protein [Tritonibacter scottomollicae]|uniref:Uncharacterized protein n=1 Tax=Tritonibacter scottomollicae TaxID=483013 RepID=A0A2T1AHC4_TRISK|nr:hypothetical protein [Tritonibacter scottomollicae]PRZ48000.1 hypothetical protein CLV89_105225 [Tritonibacter scottomollicae]
MKSRLTISAIAIFLGSVSVAQVLPYTLSDGRSEFSVVRNNNGAVLRSSGVTLYLGKDCDAYSPQFGQGLWGWANAGFGVSFPAKGKFFSFERQETPVEERNFGQCQE